MKKRRCHDEYPTGYSVQEGSFLLFRLIDPSLDEPVVEEEEPQSEDLRD